MTQAHRIPEEATPELPTTSAQASKRSGVRESKEHPMFDTPQVARDLKKGGFSEPQAEAAVSAFNVISQNMVTKADLEAALKDFPTKAELKAELKTALENHPTKTGLATLETRLTVRMLMMSGLIVGAVALIVKL